MSERRDGADLAREDTRESARQDASSVAVRLRSSGIDLPGGDSAYRAAFAVSTDALFVLEGRFVEGAVGFAAFREKVFTDAGESGVVGYALLDMNPTAERLFGEGRAPRGGEPDATLPAPLEATLGPRVVEALRSRVRLTGELEAATNLGPRSLRYDLAPSADLVVLALRDVTTEREEEAQRRRAEDRVRSIVEGTSDAYWDFDLETEGGYQSPWWLEHLGYRAEDFRGADAWWSIIHPEDAPRVRVAMRAHLDGSAPQFVAEHRLRKANGGTVWVLSRGKVVTRDEQGRPRRIAGTVTDISDLRRAEEQLRDRQRKYLAIFNSAFQYTGLLDREGRILETNYAALAFAGARADEVAGKFFWDACWWQTTPEEQLRVRELVSRAASGEFVRQELLVKDEGAREAVLDFSLTPVRDESGAVVYLVPEGRDITEKKQLEESVQRAEKMEAIGRMAGGIAHDFNNLLNVISGFNELLAADVASSGRAAVAVSEIRRAVDRAGSLIQQLLVVSRRQMLEPVVMDVHAVVVDAENMMKRAVGDGVELVLELLAEHARIHADPAKIEHVLLNLAINARDAMPEGGVLTITTRGVTVDDGHPLRASLPKPGPYLLLSVSDTGLGMDQATLERIFEPFFTTKPRGKGTGLGLATVYGIIAQSDGHIDVQTELGRGSTFHIFLPSADPG